jgi:hypothetical protein
MTGDSGEAGGVVGGVWYFCGGRIEMPITNEKLLVMLGGDPESDHRERWYMSSSCNLARR